MPIPTDNSTTSEHDSHSDSDWLDIASTDRDSDDNDSVYSSRETDHEDHSRSRSRRSSLSYGSSRDGDVDAWEGLIDDSADEGMPLAPIPHVPSLSQHPTTCDSDPAEGASSEELRVKEGLDQSMISTLSSSRSSSLHASTVHNSSRDLRLSFPDPMTSSCKEPLSTSYEEIQPDSDIPASPTDSDAPSDQHQVDDEHLLSASQVISMQPQPTTAPSLPGPELKVFLYGPSTVFKWSIVNRLLQKAAHGAGFTISHNLDNLSGSIRHLTVSGPFERDRAFPRVVTVLDRTLQPHDAAHDLTLMNSVVIRPLAVVFMPCYPLRLPEHVLHLPIQVLPSYPGELHDLSNVKTGLPQEAQGTHDIPDHQVLRITAPGGPPIVNKDSIDMLDSVRVYRAFSRLWSSDNNSKGVMASTHALTIIAVLSLVLGIIVRAALPTSLQHFTSPVLDPNYTSPSLWQIFRPAHYRERLPSTSLDGSVVAVSTSIGEFSLSVFSTESSSMTLSRANPTNIRRLIPSTVLESPDLSKDLMLQPPHSVLLMENPPKALSVIPETSSTNSYPSPTASPDMVPALMHTSVPAIVKEYSSVALAVVNQDMQDILDALDALVQAISRQTLMAVAQVTAFIEQSAVHWEKSMVSFGMVKETLHVRNEHARKRARELKERGTKWLYGASEAISTGAQLSKGKALEMVEGLASRAQRARGRAKEIAAEIQGLLDEHDKSGAHETSLWDTSGKQWDKWVKKVRKQERKGKSCRPFLRKREWAIF